MDQEVIVIGAGAAGMEAAGQLAKFGVKVKLFEKDPDLGGHLKGWYRLFPNRRDSKEVLEYLNKGLNNSNIEVLTGKTVSNIEKNGSSFIVKTEDGNSWNADSVLVTTGFDLFKSERKEEYGYGIYDNVISSADLEKMFRNGEIKCANGSVPSTVGFLHCVGSRDEKVGNFYCSKLCCISAVKQAIEVKEHLPESKVFCFYMDIRMTGAGYEEMYREAQQKYGVTFIRGKLSEVSENMEGKLCIKAEDTLVGKPLRMKLDMLVLMAGMEMSATGSKLAKNAGLALGDNRFLSPADHHFASNKGNKDGIFYAGTCTSPMSATDTISHARAAVEEVLDYLKLR